MISIKQRPVGTYGNRHLEAQVWERLPAADRRPTVTQGPMVGGPLSEGTHSQRRPMFWGDPWSVGEPMLGGRTAVTGTKVQRGTYGQRPHSQGDQSQGSHGRG